MKKREIRFGKKVLQLPCFFASVSSVKTNFSPKDYVEFLEEFGFPSYLVSAYDIINFKHGLDRLNNAQLGSKEERDSVVLLDSGNYEAYWLRDYKWNSSSYNKALETIDPDMFLSFDNAWKGTQVDLKSSNYENKKWNDLIPIIHGTPMDIADKIIGTIKRKEWKIIAKPIVAVRPWGNERMPEIVEKNADEIVGWNKDSIVDAIRRVRSKNEGQ